jgi:hypothetical protein
MEQQQINKRTRVNAIAGTGRQWPSTFLMMARRASTTQVLWIFSVALTHVTNTVQPPSYVRFGERRRLHGLPSHGPAC